MILISIKIYFNLSCSCIIQPDKKEWINFHVPSVIAIINSSITPLCTLYFFSGCLNNHLESFAAVKLETWNLIFKEACNLADKIHQDLLLQMPTEDFRPLHLQLV